VIDFKQRHGITQSYRLADGQPAVNEYVDDRTAALLVEAMKAGERAGQPVKVKAEPALEGPSVDVPSEEEPASPAPQAGKPGADKPAAKEPAAETPVEEPRIVDPAAPAAPEAPAAPKELTYVVTKDDRQAGLSGIAKRYLGSESRWREIYNLNKDLIGANANMIHISQTLKMPADAKGLPGQQAAAAPAKPADKPQAAQPVAPAENPQASKPADKPQAATPAAPADKRLTDAQVAEYAKQYGLKAERANIEAFVAEVASYPEAAVGPDTGDADTIRSLQLVLGKLGFKVAANGQFDDATAEAVIAFKQRQGLKQAYRLASGEYAINEYVDEATAARMAELLAGK